MNGCVTRSDLSHNQMNQTYDVPQRNGGASDDCEGTLLHVVHVTPANRLMGIASDPGPLLAIKFVLLSSKCAKAA
jgi:hypothetical protein